MQRNVIGQERGGYLIPRHESKCNFVHRRRAEDEQYLSLAPTEAPDAVDLGRFLPIPAINKASRGLEAILGRRLYPFM